MSQDSWAKEEQAWLKEGKEDHSEVKSEDNEEPAEHDEEEVEYNEEPPHNIPTTTARLQPGEADSEQLVNQALKKMESWIDAYFEGTLEDTEDMGKCLEWADM